IGAEGIEIGEILLDFRFDQGLAAIQMFGKRCFYILYMILRGFIGGLVQHIGQFFFQDIVLGFQLLGHLNAANVAKLRHIDFSIFESFARTSSNAFRRWDNFSTSRYQDSRITSIWWTLSGSPLA